MARPGGACGGGGSGGFWAAGVGATGGGVPAGLDAPAVGLVAGGGVFEGGGEAGFGGAGGGVAAGGTAASIAVDMLMTAVRRNRLVFMYLVFCFPDPGLGPWLRISAVLCKKLTLPDRRFVRIW